MIRPGIFGILIVVFATTIACGQYRSRYGRSDSSSESSKSRYSRSSDSNKEKADAEGSYRFLSPHERLPKGIPEWFIEKDADQDGQVKMAEYASRWSDAMVADYLKYDQNFDGFITPDECMRATGEGVVYVAPKSAPATTADRVARYGGSTFGSRRPNNESTPPPSSTPKPAAGTPTPKPATKTASEDNLPAPSKAYLGYAVRVVAKYDSNGDNQLVSDEWKAMSKDPSAADTSGDGAVTPTELARWLMPKK